LKQEALTLQGRVVHFSYPNENHRLVRLSVLVTLYLDKIFNPRSVAIVGASDEEGTVGYALMKNFTEHGFEGKVYPVNIRKTEIHGLKTYQTVEQILEPVDLAVIATPAKTVPE